MSTTSASHTQHENKQVIANVCKQFKYGNFHQRASSAWLRHKNKCSDRSELISEIHHLLCMHRRQKDQDSIRDIKRKCPFRMHQALQKAIRLCFELRITESKLYPVGDLFQELIICSGNSSSLFGLLLQNNTLSCVKSTDILYPNHSGGGDNNKAFEYYLDHAITIRDEVFEWNSGHPLDIVNHVIEPHYGLTPLIAAVQLRDPQIVLTLLRYGADPFLKLDENEEERGLDPLEILFDDLNGLYLFKKTGFSESTKHKLITEEAKGLQCLSYMRRAVLEIPVIYSKHIVTCTEDAETDEEERIKAHTYVKLKKQYSIHSGIAEELLNIDVFKPTVSLQHACRCAIRHQLRLNQDRRASSLPKMINTLPLPPLLKAYVDLLSD